MPTNTSSLCRENQAVVIDDLNVKGMPANERLARGDLGCRLWDLSPLDAPIRRAAVYFNIGAASIYVVKFLAEPLPGGKPK